MIPVTRSLLRSLRNLFRRAGISKLADESRCVVQFLANEHGLRIRGLGLETAVEYRHAGALPAQELILPLQFLDEAHGRKNDLVQLEAHSQGRIAAAWTDGDVPQRFEYPAGKNKHFEKFPTLPERLVRNPPELLTALRAAADTTDENPTRYALACIQLRGSTGQIVATNGKHALQQSGFTFPWKTDMLLPATPLLQCPELDEAAAWEVGQAGDWLTLRGGPWTIWQRHDQHGRFPRMDDILPKKGACLARVQFSEADARFLIQSLAKLPCNDQQHWPVTIALNGSVALRGKDSAGHTTELALVGSTCSGTSMNVCSNRQFAERALRLGFRELLIHKPEGVAFCDDGPRKYVWQLLSPKEAVQADTNTVRIASPAGRSPGACPVSRPIPRQRSHTVPQPQPQERPITPAEQSATHVGPVTIPSPIQQATALLVSLQETERNTRELIRSLRHQKRQTQIVQSTLASLRQLKDVA